MKFRIEKWELSELIAINSEGKLSLNPPYQRKSIWSLDDQQTLINSIKRNYPLPNIFLLEMEENFEVVDGQQRIRTILSFYTQQFEDENGEKYSTADYPNFEKFWISVIVIEEIEVDDISIEDFYVLVNSAGVHLNRPELKKAEYYDTNFLKLIEKCNSYTKFIELDLFTDSVLRRMNDMEFVSELVVLLKEGITDKKERVDKVYKSDISSTELNELSTKFNSIIDKISELNKIFLVKKTRYKQRNDFYSIVGFFNSFDFSGEYMKYIMMYP